MKANLTAAAPTRTSSTSAGAIANAPPAQGQGAKPQSVSRLADQPPPAALAPAPKRRYVESEKPSSNEYINFSHGDRARVFDYVDSYINSTAKRPAIRISNKGVAELSPSKKEDPLQNYKYLHHIGAGEPGSVASYEHKGRRYAVKTYDTGHSSEKELAVFAALAGEAREGLPKLNKVLIGGGKTHFVMETLTPIPGYGTYGDPYSTTVDEHLKVVIHDRGEHNSARRPGNPRASHEERVDIDFGRSALDPARVKAVLQQRSDDEARIADLIQKRQLTDVRFTDVDCTGFDFAGNKLSTTQVEDILSAARKIGVTPTLKGADLSEVDTQDMVFTEAWLDDAQVKQILGSPHKAKSLNYARLEDVDLTGQQLTDVDLADTYFGGTRLNGEQVRQLLETAARRQIRPNFNGAVLTEGLQGAVLSHLEASSMIDSAIRLNRQPDVRGAVIENIGRLDDFKGARIDAKQAQQVVDAARREKRTPQLRGADLSNIDVAEVNFKHAKLNTRQLSELIQAARSANKQPVLKRLDLTQVEFSGLDLNGVRFDRCKVDWGAIKQATDWQHASFGLAGTFMKLLHRA